MSLDNSAIFTSLRKNYLCPKWKVKTNSSRHLKQFDGLTWLTPTRHILQQICHWSASKLMIPLA